MDVLLGSGLEGQDHCMEKAPLEGSRDITPPAQEVLDACHIWPLCTNRVHSSNVSME